MWNVESSSVSAAWWHELRLVYCWLFNAFFTDFCEYIRYVTHMPSAPLESSLTIVQHSSIINVSSFLFFVQEVSRAKKTLWIRSGLQVALLSFFTVCPGKSVFLGTPVVLFCEVALPCTNSFISLSNEHILLLSHTCFLSPFFDALYQAGWQSTL